MIRVLLLISLSAVAGFLWMWATPYHSEGSQSQEKTDFAGNRVEAAVPVKIDKQRVMKYLRDICAIGPRMSGTKGMKKQQEMLVDHFQQVGGSVEFQRFSATQTSRTGKVELANMIVSWYPKRQRRIIICSHYDTRPIADQEPDPRNWRKPFVSANDGGSGVALLMELGHFVRELDLQFGVDFVFFDGEEYIFEPKRDRYFIGSKHFARTWRNQRERPQYLGAVLLDMIAGKNAHFPAEGYSYFRARPLVSELWQIAAQQNCNRFRQKVGDHVRDDHLALQAVGIQAVDIIDFDYPHWHKLTDTPDNCSADGMDQVARVLTVWMQRQR